MTLTTAQIDKLQNVLLVFLLAVVGAYVLNGVFFSPENTTPVPEAESSSEEVGDELEDTAIIRGSGILSGF